MAAFVLGNGISRQEIDVEILSTIGQTYGCNALYRTHTPTVLVSTDTPISETIQKSGYGLSNRFYTRRPLPNLGAKTVPQKYFGFSSGPIAISIAAMDHHSEIYLLGFDMGPTQTGTFNNIYADTEFYKTLGSAPTYTGNWVKQIMAVFRDFPATKFIRVHGQTTAKIPEFDTFSNYSSMDLYDFVARINKSKDQ